MKYVKRSSTFAKPFKLESSGQTISGTCRPATGREVAAFHLDSNRVVPEGRYDATCKFLSPRVISWDYADEDGVIVPTTAEELALLPEPFVNALWDFVTGYRFTAEAAADAKKSQ